MLAFCCNEKFLRQSTYEEGFTLDRGFRGLWSLNRAACGPFWLMLNLFFFFGAALGFQRRASGFLRQIRNHLATPPDIVCVGYFEIAPHEPFPQG